MSNTLNNVRYELKRKVQLAARRMDDTWQAELRTTAPHDTYALRYSSTVKHVQDRNRVTWTAEVDVPYAAAQAYGARPHVITARGKALRFYWPKAGKIVYFKSVHHPGNQANPWWKNSLDGARRRLQRTWESL